MLARDVNQPQICQKCRTIHEVTLTDRPIQVRNDLVAFRTSLKANKTTENDRRGASATTLARQKPAMYTIRSGASDRVVTARIKAKGVAII